MTFTFRFTLPYEVKSPESRLERALSSASQNVSAESDVSGYTGSERVYGGHIVTWTLNGIDATDLSPETRQAIIDAIQAELPGAAEFELADE